MNEQMLRELEELDVDDLVCLLGLTSEEIIRKFPNHVDAYLDALRQVEIEVEDGDDLPVKEEDDPWDDHIGDRD